jgi:ribosomal-protein-alanine N-acetyltransferase
MMAYTKKPRRSLSVEKKLHYACGCIKKHCTSPHKKFTPKNILADRTILPATFSDFPVLFNLENLSQPHPWSKENFVSELEDPHSFHFMLRIHNGDCPCSFVLARLIIDELHIHRVGTHPDFRRQGCARHLLNHAMSKARERGLKNALLEVRSGNTAAFHLYQSLDFYIAGVRKGYYGSRENALLMSRTL